MVTASAYQACPSQWMSQTLEWTVLVRSLRNGSKTERKENAWLSCVGRRTTEPLVVRNLQDRALDDLIFPGL